MYFFFIQRITVLKRILEWKFKLRSIYIRVANSKKIRENFIYNSPSNNNHNFFGFK